MSQVVSTGAVLKCSFGSAPGMLIATPGPTAAGGMPAATVMDCVGLVNIQTFVLCRSIMNPTVATATALAASPVPVPMPCAPVTSPWAPGSPTVLLGGLPALTSASTCQCAYGGLITVESPGQLTVQAP